MHDIPGMGAHNDKAKGGAPSYVHSKKKRGRKGRKGKSK